MDKCVGCQYYDRQMAKQTDSRGIAWGQCRRAAPMLHPINQKSYMIEGVWPHVRDDDWCGEWKAASRRADTRVPETVSSGPLLNSSTPSPFAPRVAATGTLQGSGSAFATSSGSGSVFTTPPASGSAFVTGRGD